MNFVEVKADADSALGVSMERRDVLLKKMEERMLAGYPNGYTKNNIFNEACNECETVNEVVMITSIIFRNIDAEEKATSLSSMLEMLSGGLKSK